MCSGGMRRELGGGASGWESRHLGLGLVPHLEAVRPRSNSSGRGSSRASDKGRVNGVPCAAAASAVLLRPCREDSLTPLEESSSELDVTLVMVVRKLQRRSQSPGQLVKRWVGPGPGCSDAVRGNLRETLISRLECHLRE